MNIPATETNQKSAGLGKAALEEVVTAIREDGYVVIEQVVDHDHLDALKERMDEDSEKLIEAEQWGGSGSVRGHLQQGPPPFEPYLFADILVNPFAIQVTRQILGESFSCSFYNGNTNTPGSGVQPLHGDGRHLWGEQPEAHPATQMIVNISPQDTTVENGATQIWPGSHLDMRPVTDEVEQDRRSHTPPVPALTRKGDLLIRDSRLWHRGVPNRSTEYRQMIAIVYNIRWMVRRRTLFFGPGAQGLFEEAGVEVNAEFLDPPGEYLFEMACRKMDPDPFTGV